MKKILYFIIIILLIWKCSYSQIPNPPILISPPGNGQVCSSFLTFDWSDVTGALSYRIQVSTDSLFIVIILDVSGLTNSGYTNTTAFPNGTYYWRVKVTTSGGTSNWSPFNKFTITAINPPSLISPPNGSMNVPIVPTLNWLSSPGTIWTRLQVALDVNFTIIILDTTFQNGFNFPPGILNYNTVYYWRIKVGNGLCISGWTNVFHFTTVNSSSVIQISSEVPTENKLYNNYPNPFNSMTNVKFQVLNNSNVTLKVFDILGKEVTTLINEKLQPGTYETVFANDQMPSGTYFYILKTDNFFNVKRMIYLK